MELGSSHLALSTVLMYLSPLEQAVAVAPGEPPEYQDATFLDAYISPAQRRKNARMSQKSSRKLRKDGIFSSVSTYLFLTLTLGLQKLSTTPLGIKSRWSLIFQVRILQEKVLAMSFRKSPLATQLTPKRRCTQLSRIIGGLKLKLL